MVKSNKELNELAAMLVQKVCTIHEYVKVTLTVTGVNKPSHSYQCKHCGKTLSYIN